MNFPTPKKIPLLIKQRLLKELPASRRYGAALALSLFFLLLSVLLHHIPLRIPYSVNFSINLAASLLASFCGGLGPGVFSGLVSTLGLDFFLTRSGHHVMELVRNLNFVFTSILISVLVSGLRSAYLKADLAMREAEKAKGLMSDLIAVISHDLKAPLTTIALRADLLSRATYAESDSPNSNDAQRHIKFLKKAARDMTQLINHLLDFEKIKMGRLLSKDLRVENVNELLLDVISALEPLAALKTITLKHSLEETALPLRCDRIRMSQVFSNLIENAIKYCSSGELIFVETRAIGGGLRCLISDSGPGIEPQHLPHIFDRFWQAHSSSHQGLGLGLSIVKEIVEAHHGEISVKSQLNAGTTFVITLPREGELQYVAME